VQSTTSQKKNERYPGQYHKRKSRECPRFQQCHTQRRKSPARKPRRPTEDRQRQQHERTAADYYGNYDPKPFHVQRQHRRHVWHVFKCYEEQDDHRQYSKTFEALDAYVRMTLPYTADLAPLFAATMKAPDVEQPDNIATDADKLTEMIFAEEVKDFVKRTRTLKSNLATIFAVAWGQCCDAMKARVKTHKGYEAMAVVANDCVWLLSQIRSVTLQFHNSKDSFMSLLDAQFGFLSCKQTEGRQVRRRLCRHSDRMVRHHRDPRRHSGRQFQVDWRNRVGRHNAQRCKAISDG
jgi:hypothetical protein